MGRISIGLDIGHRHVRAVAVAPASSAEVREGARARVVAMACVDRQDTEGRAKPLIATLAEIETLLSKRGPTTAHLGDLGTLVRLVPTMALPPDKRQRLLRLELIQHADEAGDLAADAWQIPLPGEDIIHGCVIGQPAQIIAALREIRAARLSEPAISYAPAAMANAIAPGMLTGDELALVVDIGAATAGLTLVGDGRLLACRQVPMGGDAFTDALMAAGLDRRAAERRKIDGEPPAPSEPLSTTAVSAVALDAIGDLPLPPPVSDTSFDALFEDEPAVAPRPAPAAPAHDEPLVLDLDDGTEPPLFAPAPPAIATATGAPLPLPGEVTTTLGRVALGPELQRTAEAFYAQLAASVLWFKTQLHLERLTISKVWLVGGGAALPGLDTYLQRRFNAPVTLLDPFDRLAIGKLRRPADGPAWAAALGLALSDPALGGRDAVRLDVRPESLVLAEFRRRHQIWPYIAAACIAIACICTGIVLWRESAARQASIEAYAQWKASHADLSKKLTALDADKDALSEDLRAVAGRIYAGRDLLFAVRALKEQALQSKELWVTRLETQGVGGNPGSDGAASQQSAAKSYDSAIDRGALLLSGRVKFGADKTDTGRDQFLKSWREALAAWRPAPDAPTLFLKQRMVLWDPNHRPAAKPGAKDGADEGEFPFQVEFAFRPTQLDQITALRPEKSGGGAP